jgi:hypothetical protein
MRRLKPDLDELAIAFEDASFEISRFLDLETGQVVLITEETREELNTIYAQISGQDGELQMPFDQALRRRNLPDWQQALLIEADQVEQGFGERYIRVPEADSRAAYQDMEAFIETVADGRLANLLEYAIRGRGAFRRFKDVLDDHPRERERWFTFKDQRLRQRVLEWLADQEIELVEQD